MAGLTLTEHARERIRQRGFRESDVALIERYGTPGVEGVVLLRRDAARAIAERKREIQRLEQLAGAALVVEDGVVVSIYRPCRTRRRRLLRQVA